MHIPTETESLEAVIDLVRLLAQASPLEAIRKQGDAVQHADHMRRNAVLGLHPLAGETQADYEAHMADPARGGRGFHPVTGETAEHYAEHGFPTVANPND